MQPGGVAQHDAGRRFGIMRRTGPGKQESQEMVPAPHRFLSLFSNNATQYNHEDQGNRQCGARFHGSIVIPVRPPAN